ncbi:hypothetical protein [Acetobacter sp. P5B1]|uniref:hypothetical protein n=1 Tax=Acetobacter sp. P5B1 TaxID=2762620 RepID=UPI001C055FC8|nr:hypothetical protein [Acetobacter sp. P5B1]
MRLLIQKFMNAKMLLPHEHRAHPDGTVTRWVSIDGVPTKLRGNLTVDGKKFAPTRRPDLPLYVEGVEAIADDH